MKTLKILFAASEMVPFCKTGGLADVIGSLPPVLAEMGHDVRVMLPGYSVIDREKYGFQPLPDSIQVPLGTEMKPLTLSSATLKGVTVYLLENIEYFSRDHLYGDAEGDYPDNGHRFIFFARGVIEAAKSIGLKPDILHAHDWQAGLIMPYLSTLYKDDPAFRNTSTLFTIHNLGYQGLFPKELMPVSGIPLEEYQWKKMEFWGKVGFLKSGIVYADAVSTVSETYAKEITEEELGFGLDGVFETRKHNLFGIVNGIDQDEWDPSTDKHIVSRYHSDDLSGKHICRRALLDEFAMRADSGTPVIGMVTRLDDQKGLDIFEDAIARLVSLDIRLVILGTGAQKHHDTMISLMERYSGSIHAILKFDNRMARMIYAGSDAFIMPSRYEPCGLGQLIAMRYGALPIVRATGGLADTVFDLDTYSRKGNGFVFKEYSADALVGAVTRSVKAFRARGRRRWNNAVTLAMKTDFSWGNAAEKYLALFASMRKNKKS